MKDLHLKAMIWFEKLPPTERKELTEMYFPGKVANNLNKKNILEIWDFEQPEFKDNI